MDESEKALDGVQQLEYSIKIMNPDRLSEYTSVRICKWKVFNSLKDLRLFLSAKVPQEVVNRPNFDSTALGYIEPGHGLKGKKQWLHTDGDLKAMYDKHVGKRNVLLWALSQQKTSSGRRQKKLSESSKDGTVSGKTNYQQHKSSLSEVDEKYEELRNMKANILLSNCGCGHM